MSITVRKGGVAGLVGAAIAAVLSLFLTTSTVVGTWNPANAYEVPATQEIRYQPRFEDGDWLAYRGLDAVIDRLRDVLARPAHKGEGYRLRSLREDTKWSRIRNLNETMKRLHERLANAAPGRAFVVLSVKDRWHAYARKVDRNPAKIYNTQGVWAIDVIIGSVIQEVPSLRSAGLCVCKRISGTYTWSQHAYCNAIDLVDTHANLDKAVAYLRWLDRNGYAPVGLILWQVTNHYSHAHVEGSPRSPNGLSAC